MNGRPRWAWTYIIEVASTVAISLVVNGNFPAHGATGEGKESSKARKIHDRNLE